MTSALASLRVLIRRCPPLSFPMSLFAVRVSRLRSFVGFVTFLAASTAGLHGADVVSSPHVGDDVGFMHVFPDRLKAGAEQSVHLSISYDLKTRDSALIEVMFNERSPEGFETAAEAVVASGRGTVQLTARVRPVHWSDTQPFRARVVLRGSANRPDELKRAEQVIYNADAKAVPVDGVRILAVSPELLEVGREQEVAVLVEFNLQRADEGKLYLGFNHDAPKTFTLLSEELVRKGKGQKLLVAKVTPRSWGDQARFVAFVNLSAANHARAWGPLATDIEAVELDVSP